MSVVTSTMHMQAIIFAHERMKQAIESRDADPRLFLANTYAKTLMYQNDKHRFYLRIVFDYWIRNEAANSNAPDLFIDLEPLPSGGFKVLTPPGQ